MSAETPHWVTVARVLRARGNKGEVAAELMTDFPERLAKLGEVFLFSGKGEPRRAGIKSFWVSQNHIGQAVFHFAGCDSIEDAEKLRGLEVQIPFEQRVTLPEGQYFVTELIGCEVFQGSTRLGMVRDVYFPGETQAGTPLLSVERSEGELLIPLAEDICKRIDVAARRIEAVLPEGLDE